MALLTLLPLGTLQLFASLENGYWYARSAEFMQQPLVDLLVWLRVPGDTIFAIGAVALAIFVGGLWLFPRRESEEGRIGVPSGPGDDAATDRGRGR
jgi:nitric oxide reductase subunit B